MERENSGKLLRAEAASELAQAAERNKASSSAASSSHHRQKSELTQGLAANRSMEQQLADEDSTAIQQLKDDNYNLNVEMQERDQRDDPAQIPPGVTLSISAPSASEEASLQRQQVVKNELTQGVEKFPSLETSVFNFHVTHIYTKF